MALFHHRGGSDGEFVTSLRIRQGDHAAGLDWTPGGGFLPGLGTPHHRATTLNSAVAWWRGWRASRGYPLPLPCRPTEMQAA